MEKSTVGASISSVGGLIVLVSGRGTPASRGRTQHHDHYRQVRVDVPGLLEPHLRGLQGRMDPRREGHAPGLRRHRSGPGLASGPDVLHEPRGHRRARGPSQLPPRRHLPGARDAPQRGLSLGRGVQGVVDRQPGNGPPARREGRYRPGRIGPAPRRESRGRWNGCSCGARELPGGGLSSNACSSCRFDEYDC